jgi:hypothetical protein
MKRILLAAVALTTLLAATQASATELWDPHLRGTDEGLAAGAALPPGVYGVWDQWYSSMAVYNSGGHDTGVHVDALVEVPILLWQSGYRLLGGQYSAGLALPFDYTNTRIAGVGALADNGHWGTFNTILIPGQLSWTLPHNFHAKLGLTVYLDDASSSPGNPAPGGGVGSGNGYSTIQPDLGISWLKDGWNLSVSTHYAVNMKNTKTDYQSGDEFMADYTITKDIGKWTVGLGGYSENQLSSDTGTGAAACTNNGGCRVAIYGIGPLVGYNFGGAIGMIEYNAAFANKMDAGGNELTVRLVIPF